MADVHIDAHLPAPGAIVVEDRYEGVLELGVSQEAAAKHNKIRARKCRGEYNHDELKRRRQHARHNGDDNQQGIDLFGLWITGSALKADDKV